LKKGLKDFPFFRRAVGRHRNNCERSKSQYETSSGKIENWGIEGAITELMQKIRLAKNFA
jgi:hypothetical protein